MYIMTITHGKFEWDDAKDSENVRKHGFGFAEILPVFDDPLFWEKLDEAHSTDAETRYFGTGKINGFAVIVSSYTERNGKTRIINARIASSEEEKRYEKWCEFFYS